MQQYYEILDQKYWVRKKHFRPQKDDSLFKIIACIGAGFLFWGLALWANGTGRVVCNVLGWGFAFSSLYFVKLHPKLRI